MSLNVVSRETWNAEPPKFTGPIRHPISYVFSGYTRTSTCHMRESCAKELQFDQKRHQKYGPDIKYNFMISSTGQVFEGRGWLAKPGLPGRYRDIQYTSLFIGFIGTFEVNPPSLLMQTAKNNLIKYGMEQDLIQKQILEFNLEGLTAEYY